MRNEIYVEKYPEFHVTPICKACQSVMKFALIFDGFLFLILRRSAKFEIFTDFLVQTCAQSFLFKNQLHFSMHIPENLRLLDVSLS